MVTTLKKNILIINAGSSSIKFQLYLIDNNANFKVVCKGLAERINVDGRLVINYQNQETTINVKMPDHQTAATTILEYLKQQQIIKDFKNIIAVGHRIVHGGLMRESVIVNEKVIKNLQDNIKLAPLHNPAGLSALEAFRSVTNCQHTLVFDTTFHQTMPKINYIYPVPDVWYHDYQVRRYGFHGISYHYIMNQLPTIINKTRENINAIICHLGNGASLCAIKNGQSYNTSMGMTPLAGLMMGTRSGDIDPGIYQYLSQQLNITSEEITNQLNSKSGLLGISGISSDTREIIKQLNSNDRARFALELYVKRIVDYIVQYQNDLDNKVDALVFSAGIGENSPVIRKMILEKIKTMDLKFDDQKNHESYQDYLPISTSESALAIYAIRTNEELMICKETYRLITLGTKKPY